MAHNGGRSQVGLNNPAASEFAFLNHLKGAQVWAAGTTAYPAILNANGYPQSDPATDLQTAFFIPNTVTDYTGSWIVDWEGSGQIQIAGGGYTVTEGGGFVSGSTLFNLTCVGVGGRVKYTHNAVATHPTFYIQDSEVPDPIHNIRVYRADQEANVLAGEYFNPLFLTKMRELNFGIIRFMDWSGVNNNGSQVKWAHRASVDDFSWSANKWVPGLWGGAVAGTDTYTAAAAADTPGSWTDGETWQGQFTNANTSTTPTINIGGRGAKTIVNSFAAALSVGGIAANALVTLIYSSTLDKVIYSGVGINAGVPIEVMIALCNELDAHLWYTYPFWAEDTWVTQASTLFKNTLTNRAYQEYNNEIWNFAFTQTSLASALGAALGYPSGNNERIHGWYAKRYTEMANLIAAVGGSKYRRVIAVQAAGNGPEYDNWRFKGGDLGVVAPNRPVDKCEALSFATYFQGANVREFSASWVNPLDDSVNPTDDILGAADDYGSGNPALMQAALDYVDADVRAGSKSGVAGSATLAAFEGTIYGVWHGYAVTYNKKLIEYEGALALDAPTTARLTTLGYDTAYRTKILALIAAYKNDNRAKQITLDRYNGFTELAQAEFPSQYQFVGGDPWAVVNGSLYTTPYKTYDAIVEFNPTCFATQRDVTELCATRLAAYRECGLA